MPNYKLPTISERAALEPKTVCWSPVATCASRLTHPVGDTAEAREGLISALADSGGHHRAHSFDPVKGTGSLTARRWGCLFRPDPPDALWWSPNGLAVQPPRLGRLRSHRGRSSPPPFRRHLAGLVGMLGLNASMAKMGRQYSTIWSTDFKDKWFCDG